MSTQAPSPHTAAAPPPPVVTAKPAPKAPSTTPAGFAIRAATTALILAGCFKVYAHLLDLFGRLTGSPPEAPTPKALAVTLVCACLVAVWWKVIRNDKRFYAPVFITYILAVADATYGVLENHHSEWLASLTGGRVSSFSPTFVAILATLAMEMVLARFTYGKWPHLASAYISGISVGILIKSPDVWPFILCGLISITSKYVLRVGGRHLWNPTNFGVTMMLFLAPASVASLSVQSGNEIWPVLVIWALGGVILYSLGKLHIPLVFVSVFVPLAFLRSYLTGRPWQAELAPVTWPMFQLYIFFMITDPKTVTKAVWSQCLVAVLIAVAETVLRLCEDVHALYHALFIVGPIANLVEIWWTARHPKAAKPAALPTAAG
jgi:hypothetical protein